MTEEFKRRILVCVTGMTPQVVTETLYALLEEGTVPTEVHLITTEDGRNCALRDLLDPQTGQFYAFCRDTNCTGQICFDRDSIHVIDDAAGKPLSDIRTPEDNNRAADLIVRLLQAYCSDDDSAVYVSLAGGRKTMGFFAGYALSLFGRSQDRLLHVLVSPPFESNREFFYPTQSKRLLQEGMLDASQAKVAMADIPFVRMLEGLPELLQSGKTGYSEAVKAAQRHIVPPVEISFDIEKKTVICGGVEVRMPTSEFATYLWLSQRCKRLQEPIRPGVNTKEEFLRVYRQILDGVTGDYDCARKRIEKASFLRYFSQRVSTIKAKIKGELGEKTAEPYFVKSYGTRPSTTYALSIRPDQIHLPNAMQLLRRG